MTRWTQQARRAVPRGRTARVICAAVLLVALAAGVGVVLQRTILHPTRLTAYFRSATAIYVGDHVRIVGIDVGTITAIEPHGGVVKVNMNVDRGIAIPADADAVIVAQNLLAARYIQLTPAYHRADGGPIMRDGAVIPLERTAVPVEWDEVKNQLMRLATEMGPRGDMSSTAVGRFVDSTANAADGNGAKLRQTLTELAGAGRILAGSGSNIVEIIKNLQTLLTALSNSGEQIVDFGTRLATLTSVLSENRTALDAMLTDLSDVLGDIQRFISESRDGASEQVQRLANVTQTLVDRRTDLENILHLAPNSLANGYGIYNPDTGDVVGTFVFHNFTDPVQYICTAIGAIKNTTGAETAKLCAQYLGPALSQLSLNYIPVPINPVLGKSASPDNLIYTDPALMPGQQQASSAPAEMPPAVSAYPATAPVATPSDAPPQPPLIGPPTP